ncbi:MAG TPA: hypothetical protein VK177_19345 [Flavobacteriales bacterium]|nr:hypothetical protein [Flavobacteriales bacterium]
MNQHTKRDKKLIVTVIVYHVVLIAFSLSWIFSALLDPFKNWFLGTPADRPVQHILFSFFFAGMLGGSFYCLRGIYERLADAYTAPAALDPEKRKNARDVFNIEVWIFWYLYRPLQSGILAIVIICLFNQGLFEISSIDTEKVASLYFQIGLGFLIGFGTHEVVGKMEELIRVLFARNQSNKNQLNPGGASTKAQERINDDTN